MKYPYMYGQYFSDSKGDYVHTINVPEIVKATIRTKICIAHTVEFTINFFLNILREYSPVWILL